MPDHHRSTQAPIPLAEVLVNGQFRARPPRPRDPLAESLALHQLAESFLADPATILQKLVDLTLTLAHAESSGITLETTGDHGETLFRWVATGGAYAHLAGATLPANSPCAVCIAAQQPQVFALPERHFTYLYAANLRPVAEVLLLPWVVDATLRGTLWVVNHSDDRHFDPEDARILAYLANFAGLALRFQRSQEAIRALERKATAGKLAADLAHRINNPLQAITTALYLLGEDPHPTPVSRTFLPVAQQQLDRINRLIAPILESSAEPITFPKPPTSTRQSSQSSQSSLKSASH